MGGLKLYELAQQHRQLESLLDCGDLPPEVIRDTLEAVTGEIEIKAKSVAHIILNLESFANEVQQVAQAAADRAQRVKRRAESIRSYLLLQMQISGVTRVEAPEFTIAVRKNPPAIEIDELAVVPAEYMITPEPPPARPDKKLLATALKAGAIIPGVWLRTGEHLSIKV